MKTEEKIHKFKNIQEPEDFYIMSTNDDLVLNSKEAVETLLKDLDNAEYDKKLSDFYIIFNNDIKDLTKKIS